jgi:hypothetical protein
MIVVLVMRVVFANAARACCDRTIGLGQHTAGPADCQQQNGYDCQWKRKTRQDGIPGTIIVKII